MTRCKICNLPACFFKKHTKCKTCRFQGVSLAKLWFFECNFFSKSDTSENFLIKIYRVVIFPIKWWCVVFLIICKIWHVVNFFIQNLLFKPSFQFLSEILSKWYQLQWTICWKMTTACFKKLFMSVWPMFVSHLLLLFVHCVPYTKRFLNWCDDYINCTTHWFLQTSLQLKKWLV